MAFQKKSSGKDQAILFAPRIATICFALTLFFFGFETPLGGPSTGAGRAAAFLGDQRFLQANLQKVKGPLTVAYL